MKTQLPTEALPGLVVLFGSGETSPSGRKVFDRILKTLPVAPRVALLETPAGFELNSEQVIGRVGEFLRHRLQNYQPQVEVVRALRRGAALSPDDPQVVAPLLEADLIFMGPGSPTYAVRQLRGSLAWQYMAARHRLGGALALASAAVVAIGAWALPVYEIYKVGEDLHWKEGLDFFGQFGLPLVFIPHWNNNDGGEELDTSRCFMGQERFAALMDMLPADLTVLGIDEKTALVMDIQAGVCRVIGLGGVTLLHTGHRHRGRGLDLSGTGLSEVVEPRQGHVHWYKDGQTFPLSECCPLEVLPGDLGLPDGPAALQAVFRLAREVQARREVERQAAAAPPPAPQEVDSGAVPPEVLALVKARQEARARKDWAASDALRTQLAEMGWQVVDTPEGQKVSRTGG